MTTDNYVEVPFDDAPADAATEEQWERAGQPLQVHIDKALANSRSAAVYERRTDEIRAKMHSLRQLRSAQSLTQATVGELLGMTQSEVSRLEHRSDMLVSTLRRFIEATGGALKVEAVYPDNQVIELTSGVFPAPEDNDLYEDDSSAAAEMREHAAAAR